MMEIKPLLAYNTWLALPTETRHKLEKLFNMPKTGEVVVNIGAISPEGNISGNATSDGHKAGDLYAISIEKMQEFTGSKSKDFYALFNETVSQLNGPVVPMPDERPIEMRKKRGRPAKARNGTS